jgi:hypothetical protein
LSHISDVERRLGLRFENDEVWLPAIQSLGMRKRGEEDRFELLLETMRKIFSFVKRFQLGLNHALMEPVGPTVDEAME